ncbi:HAD family hydrolase [Herbaspirillum hiltneri N3]|uniref:(S)-2-haloacid dehalogenase n=1 Tax=Herbaspirillum hiltneri N3 TaxID=1262470 RepID=A0ABN4HZB7_9BURK|nr:HAD family hydrolase [Herbaspirillum hiltneri N3]
MNKLAGIKAVVFDLYGTLYNVHSVAQRCDEAAPGRGMEVSVLWRQKQLEYSWLRSLMGQTISFEQATRDALAFVSAHFKLELDTAAMETLCDAYLNLSPYPEVPDALRKLQEMKLPMAILSNGSDFSISKVVGGSGLQSFFSHLLSVDAVGVFKPDSRVYALAGKAFSLAPEEMLFVSSNAWDAAGAAHYGFTVCWINRSGNTFDELGISPAVVVGGLDEVPGLLLNGA